VHHPFVYFTVYQIPKRYLFYAQHFTPLITFIYLYAVPLILDMDFYILNEHYKDVN
jgi:hypothetical protein